jgi:hypothetical protein
MRKYFFVLGLLVGFLLLFALQAGAVRAAGRHLADPIVQNAPNENLIEKGGRSWLALQPTAAPQDTLTPRGRPTRTPRPTATPPTIPPPSDPESASLMIGFGTLVVIVVVAGVWLNRKNTG